MKNIIKSLAVKSGNIIILFEGQFKYLNLFQFHQIISYIFQTMFNLSHKSKDKRFIMPVKIGQGQVSASRKDDIESGPANSETVQGMVNTMPTVLMIPLEE